MNSEDYVTILNWNTFRSWLKKIKKSRTFCLNIKISASDDLHNKIIGIAFAVSPGKAAYLPLHHDYCDAPIQLDQNHVLHEFKLLLEDDKIIKIAQNLKSQIEILKKYNIVLNGIQFDILLESYCLNSIFGKHDISSLAKYWLNYELINFKKIVNETSKQLSFDHIPVKKATKYLAEHTDIVLQVHMKIWEKLQKKINQKIIFEEIEMPLLHVISRVEQNGVLINKNILLQYSEELCARLDNLTNKAYEIAGQPFNLLSTKQIQDILFTKQGIKPIKKTQKGSLSTNEEVLMKLSLHHPLAKIILEYRNLAKIKSTYVDKLPILINKKSGRLHTSYHQIITSTGRLSCSNPNLQNIPVRTIEGRRIRKAFIAESNKYIVSADYSQIELRIMAHLSQDKSLLNSFIQDEDIHVATASEIFSIPCDQVSTEQRHNAKAINFGLIYGMSPFGLSRRLNINSNQAKNYMKIYFDRYPNVDRYMKEIRQSAFKYGYVETLKGRRLWIPNIRCNNIVQRKAAERTAINAPMQGSAADIIKMAMIKLDHWIDKNDHGMIKMIMQIHDELVFEIHKNIIQIAMNKIRFIMENIITLDVPLKVIINKGLDWSEAH